MRRLLLIVAAVVLMLWLASPAFAQTGAGGAGMEYGLHHAAMAQEMGVKMIACTTSCGIMGVSEEALRPEVTLMAGAATYLGEAKTMVMVGAGSDYAAGYLRGLHRAHEGERWGTEAEHALMLALERMSGTTIKEEC